MLDSINGKWNSRRGDSAILPGECCIGRRPCGFGESEKLGQLHGERKRRMEEGGDDPLECSDTNRLFGKAAKGPPEIGPLFWNPRADATAP